MSRHLRCSLPWRGLLTGLALVGCVTACDVDETLDVSAITPCPGAMAPSGGTTPCRDDADCAGVDGFDPFCRPTENPPRICGAPLCNRECESDTDCSTDATRVCVEFLATCSGVCGPDTRCQPACTETSCEEGFTCADDGHCRALPCDGASFSCPANLRCAPDSDEVDAHGCQRLACERDSDCDCGACVTGRCWGHLGLCESGDPVP